MSVVTVSDARDYIKLGAAVQTTLIQLLIDSAEEWLAQQLDVSFTPETVTDELCDGGNTILYVEKLPVWVITEVKDATDDTVVEADHYRLNRRGPERIDTPMRFADYRSVRWYSGHGRWKVTYEAGYDDETSGREIPAGVKHLILDIFMRGWFNRGNPALELSTGGNQAWGLIIGTDLQRRIDNYTIGRRV